MGRRNKEKKWTKRKDDTERVRRAKAAKKGRNNSKK